MAIVSSSLVPTSLLVVGVLAALSVVYAEDLAPNFSADMSDLSDCHIQRTFCLMPLHICDKVICNKRQRNNLGDSSRSSPTDMPKRSKPTFMRLGKRSANFMRFGKRASTNNFMRFGKRADLLQPVLVESQVVPYDAAYDNHDDSHRSFGDRVIRLRLGR